MMDVETNQFHMSDNSNEPGCIAFFLDEEIVIKNHVFKVVHVDIPKFGKSREHLLVLTPVRKVYANG
jgi:hypothetical protein